MMPTKRKTITKTSKSYKTGARQHPKHFLKVYWPYLPILSVVTFGMFFGGVNPRARQDNPATLAYSTEMSINGLLSGTNTQRKNRGMSSYKLNSKLNASAQAKANDMVAKDYWSHNSPNGDEPWVFFDAAGYSYQKAGENLAYGFATSSDTIIGWMNSPSHRANILDSTYTEVGFGFANSSDFVNTGNETIVVAHYGKPLNSSAPKTTQPAPQTQQSVRSAENSNAKPEASEKEIVKEQPEEQLKQLPEERINQPINSDNPNTGAAESKNITRLQRLTKGEAPWSAVVLSTAAFVIVIIWLVKHAVLVKRFVLKGEHFVAHHPLLDLFVVIIAAIAVYLSQSSGVVL